MKKSELVAALQFFDDDAEVWIWDANEHYQDNTSLSDVIQITNKTGRKEINLII